ncbi:beta-1,4-N-acetylgalactosaminyltransferase bre-4-like [Daphnia pulex]|uniref:beta-1,4-N-acetylgalactosaminyltransferase bre-4-like n=1 Tax=Daphnia pulex TaxID=6669 RepID=UPI001EDD2903|nr:beta-1,4-N-acetylgalactosaminyltransferase bre-4-like [Daphnia pulex]
MSFVIDIHDYKPVSLMFLFGGGVIAISAVDFVRANGYSIAFWGLGLEDDDFYRRIRRLNMSVARPNIPAEHLRYRTLYHDPSVDVNSNRPKLFDDGYRRFESDGLINLKYRPSDAQLKPLYTHVVVELTEDNLD